MERSNRSALALVYVFCLVLLGRSAAAAPQSGIAGWGLQHFDSRWNHEPFLSISAGAEHTLAQRADGSLVAWGFGYYGQCSVPLLPPGRSFAQICAGGMNNVALLSDASILVWGANLPAAPPAPAGLNYVEVAASCAWYYPPIGYNLPGHALARLDDGTVVGWGSDIFGQCDAPPPPAGLGYVEVAAGAYHSLGRLSDGSIVTWGYLGSGVPGLPLGSTCAELAAGGFHSLARLSDGTILAWGDNTYGQCNVPPIPAGLSCVE